MPETASLSSLPTPTHPRLLPAALGTAPQVGQHYKSHSSQIPSTRRAHGPPLFRAVVLQPDRRRVTAVHEHIPAQHCRQMRPVV